MDIKREVENVINLMKRSDYYHAKQTLDSIIKEVERNKTGFDKCNVCNVCRYLSEGECTATKEVRLTMNVNGPWNCEVMYQQIKYMDFITHDPKHIEERERFSREMSNMSIEDMLRPFTI